MRRMAFLVTRAVGMENIAEPVVGCGLTGGESSDEVVFEIIT